MALIPCPECGTNVSDQATACPSCGRPFKEGSQAERVVVVRDRAPEPSILQKRVWGGGFLALILVVFIIAGINAAYQGCSYRPPADAARAVKADKTPRLKYLTLDGAGEINAINLFSEKGPSRLITTVITGTVVLEVRREGDWVLVRTRDGKSGWVSHNLVMEYR